MQYDTTGNSDILLSEGCPGGECSEVKLGEINWQNNQISLPLYLSSDKWSNKDIYVNEAIGACKSMMGVEFADDDFQMLKQCEDMDMGCTSLILVLNSWPSEFNARNYCNADSFPDKG
jgi:hypothetical protein